MGLRGLFVLLLLVGALVGVLFLTDEKPKATDTAAMSVLDGRSLGECKRIWWQFPDHQPVEITRTEKGFSMTEPLVDLVSPGYWKQIVDAWTSAQLHSTPIADDEEGRKRAGFAPPALALVIEYPDGRRYDVEVGEPGPLGGTRFLRMHGKIWEAGEAVFESMRVGIDDMRDRSVFRNPPSAVGELRVDRRLPDGKREVIQLARDKTGWRLLAPRPGRADTGPAQRFLTAITTLRVDDFPRGLVRWPEDDPAIVIEVKGALGAETVRLWERDGQVFGRLPGRGDLAFVSDNRQYSQVFVNAFDELRARILFPVANVYQDVVEIVVDPGVGRDKRTRLLRDGIANDWRLVEPVEIPADVTACNDLLQAVNNLQVVEFVDEEGGKAASAVDPRYGLGPTRVSVGVRTEQSKDLTTLWLGAAVERDGTPLVYACRSDEAESVVLVGSKPAEMARRSWLAYCTSKIVRLTVPIEQVVLTRRATAEQRVFQREKDHWVLKGVEGSRDDVGELANDELRDLVGKRAIDVSGDEYRSADWTLDLARSDGDKLISLRIFDRAPDAPLVVQVTTSPVGYEVGPRLDGELRRLWK